jgi:hypothetical protein
MSVMIREQNRVELELDTECRRNLFIGREIKAILARVSLENCTGRFDTVLFGVMII